MYIKRGDGQPRSLMARQLKKLSVKAGLHRGSRDRHDASLQMVKTLVTWLISGSTFIFSTFQPTDLNF